MTTTTHTPASLLALHRDDPRKLDALAAEVVMGYVWRTPTVGTDAGKGKLLCAPDSFYGKHPHWVEPSTTAEIWQDSFDGVPKYSASRDAAALLEQRLAERGLDENYAARLVSICTGDGLSHMEGIGISMECVTDYWAAFRFATAKPHQRTIAAVLVAQ